MKRSAKRISVFCALTVFSAITAAADETRPNIVIIMCDDLGYSDVGFNGATDIRTPALDRLAKRGMICGSGYVSHPFCGPSRMGLISGRYPHAFGGPFNLPNSGTGIEEYNQQGLPVGETLISTVLQDAGYYTGAIGKWHMGITAPFHPNTRGFDDFYGFLGGGHSYFPESYRPAYEKLLQAGKKDIPEYLLPLEHNGKEVQETEYITDALSREAVRFVNDAAQKKQPFFLYLAYNAPHTPLQAKEEDLQHYSDIRDEDRRTYAAMVHAVDRGVGEFVDALKQTGKFDDTLIVFLSDNGGKLTAGATNHPLQQGKGSTFEGGYRVPMFFHWPEQIPAGQRYDHPVSALDLYPTFARLAGAKIPNGKILDGKDIWADVMTGKNARKGGMIFAMRHRGNISDVARQDQWKIVHFGGANARWKLFNLKKDVGEKHDLSREYPELLRGMISKVEVWSQGHTQPLWFHTIKARDTWKQNNMPNNKDLFQAVRN